MSAILAVDDDEDAHFLLNRAVRKAALEVTLISLLNGEQAIDYLAGTDKFADRTTYPLPALILLDLKMPKKNGFEVLEFIQQRHELQVIPVIVFSSSDEKIDIVKAYGLGCRAYVRKPGALGELNAFVSALGHEFFPNCLLPKAEGQLSKSFSGCVLKPQ